MVKNRLDLPLIIFLYENRTNFLFPSRLKAFSLTFILSFMKVNGFYFY